MWQLKIKLILFSFINNSANFVKNKGVPYFQAEIIPAEPAPDNAGEGKMGLTNVVIISPFLLMC